MQAEARCQQAEEQAEKKEQELRSQVSSLEEATLQSENQVKELKETIFELEDQVEQHRAVNCHTNQAVLDMESMSLPVCFHQMHLIGSQPQIHTGGKFQTLNWQPVFVSVEQLIGPGCNLAF